MHTPYTEPLHYNILTELKSIYLSHILTICMTRLFWCYIHTTTFPMKHPIFNPFLNSVTSFTSSNVLGISLDISVPKKSEAAPWGPSCLVLIWLIPSSKQNCKSLEPLFNIFFLYTLLMFGFILSLIFQFQNSLYPFPLCPKAVWLNITKNVHHVFIFIDHIKTFRIVNNTSVT